MTMGLLAFGVWRLTLLFNETPSTGSPRVVPLTSLSGFEDYPTFSPDGQQIAYAHAADAGRGIVIPAREGAAGVIYVQGVGDERAVPLVEDGGRCPAWSPDGLSIAYNRYWQVGSDSKWEPGGWGTAIAVMSPLGGSQRDVIRVTPRFECTLSWSPDSHSLAFAHEPENQTEGIFVVSVKDGSLQRVTTPPFGTKDEDPAFSEDGSMLAFVRHTSWGTGDVYIVHRDGSGLRRLTFSNSNVGGPLWEAGGKELLFWSSPSGSAWSTDLYRVNIVGDPPQRLPFGSGDAGRPAISRAANRLAYAKFALDVNIWSFSLSSEDSAVKLQSSSRIDVSPALSRDNRRLAFVSDRDGGLAIWISNTDGSHAEKLIPLHQGGSPAWSPTDRWIAYDSRDEGQSRIYVVDLITRERRKLTGGSHDDVVPSWSADGKWVYFASNRTGEWNIWKVRAEGGDAVQLTRAGGLHPFESADGKFVYFAKPARQPDVGTVFEAQGIWRMPAQGGPEELFLSTADAPLGWLWAVNADGIYFATLKDAGVEMKRFDFRTRRLHRLGELDKLPWGGPGLAVSRDGRTILFSTIDSASSDIVLVENYR
jgi:Tol biopolymer transport system component